MTTLSTSSYDAIIIGGSYSGLQAALTLGRSLCKALVLDGGEPCNRYAAHAHNILTHDGSPPHEIAKRGKEQIESNYSEYVSFHHGLATGATKRDDGLFEITTNTGDVVVASKVILATGVHDKIPSDIPGFADCWGKTIVHCPFCHGYELRNRPVAFWAPNYMVITKLLALICKLAGKDHRVSVLCSTALTGDQAAQVKGIPNVNLVAHGDDCRIQTISHNGNGLLEAIELKNGTIIDVGVLYAHLPFEQADIVQQFGCDMTDFGHVLVDPMQKTNVDGLLACGDCATPFRTVPIAMAQGNMAGVVAAMELANQEYFS